MMDNLKVATGALIWGLAMGCGWVALVLLAKVVDKWVSRRRRGMQ